MNKSNDANEDCKLIVDSRRKRRNVGNKLDIMINQKKYHIVLFIFVIIFFIFIFLKIFNSPNIELNESDLNFIYIKNETLINELNNIIANFNISMNENFSVPSEPIVTVIIPVYNIEKTIKRTIISIQNQDLKEIEILLIDDCSTDNSVNIISELQKSDNRIKLLKNKKNKGTLYTRSIGAINAKSKYIITINNNDLFIGDIFNICKEESRLNNIDIIEFSGYNSFINITSNYSLIKLYRLYYKKENSLG